MPIAAVAVGAKIIDSGIKANASRKAAHEQLMGIKDAKAATTSAYDEAKGYQDPYLAAGKQSIGDMAAGVAQGGEFNRKFSNEDFGVDPGYQFRLEQAQKAQEHSAAARGGALSGAAIKGATDYSQGLAAQEYQSAFQRYQSDLSGRYNRLADVAGRGQRAADVRTGAATDYGNTMSGLAVNKGNVNAAKDLAYGQQGVNAVNTVANAKPSDVGGGSLSSYGSGAVSAAAGSTSEGYTGNAMDQWLKTK